jgi:hypothetical protein
MQNLNDLYKLEIQQERFAMLVAARVNDILSGEAKVLEFPEVGSVFNPTEQQQLIFADKTARIVCATLNKLNSGEV